MGMVENAQAQIVWSGIVNINIPSTTSGVYLNVVTGVSNSSPAAVPGWDVNPWSSSTLSFFNPSTPSGGVYVIGGGTGTQVANLAPGTLIGPASTYGGGAAASSGSLPFNVNSSDNIVGFRFNNEAGSTLHYGWMRISLSGTLSAQPRAIVEYAFELTPNTPIQAGAIPTPGTLALLGLGAAGLVSRRRK